MLKKKEAKVRRVNRILLIVSVIVGVNTLINAISLQYSVNLKKEEIDTLSQDISRQSYIIEEINGKIEEGATDEAIIEVAQKKLGLALPGERVIADIGSK